MGTTLPGYYWEIMACPSCAGKLQSNGDAISCLDCNQQYPSRKGQPDLRLNSKKTVTLSFDMGVNMFPDKNFDLTEVNQSETELAFNGDVKLTGLLASMGQRMVSGVANTLIKQFFANMEKELQKQFAS